MHYNTKKIEKECLICGNKFYGAFKEKLCSKECARVRNNLLRMNGNHAMLLKQEMEAEQKQKAKSLAWRKGDPDALDKNIREAAKIGVTYGEYVTAKSTMTKERFKEWKEARRCEMNKSCCV